MASPVLAFFTVPEMVCAFSEKSIETNTSKKHRNLARHEVIRLKLGSFTKIEVLVKKILSQVKQIIPASGEGRQQ
tara:strand:- start:3144 stop:3368 length:225 start_codon:yes stop_codon:yes gene_type:complete